MRSKFLAAAALAATIAGLGVVSVGSSASAAPAGAPVQTDLTTFTGTTTAVGRLVVTFNTPLEVKTASDKDGTGTHLDFDAAVAVLAPTGGQGNLPGQIFNEGPILNRDGTLIVGVQLRFFSIQVAGGQLAPLANTSVTVRTRANSGDEVYCQANACS